jgi:hypothetical protein
MCSIVRVVSAAIEALNQASLFAGSTLRFLRQNQ